jgi:hypothetical protein
MLTNLIPCLSSTAARQPQKMGASREGLAAPELRNESGCQSLGVSVAQVLAYRQPQGVVPVADQG